VGTLSPCHALDSGLVRLGDEGEPGCRTAQRVTAALREPTPPRCGSILRIYRRLS